MTDNSSPGGGPVPQDVANGSCAPTIRSIADLKDWLATIATTANRVTELIAGDGCAVKPPRSLQDAAELFALVSDMARSVSSNRSPEEPKASRLETLARVGGESLVSWLHAVEVELGLEPEDLCALPMAAVCVRLASSTAPRTPAWAMPYQPVEAHLVHAAQGDLTEAILAVVSAEQPVHRRRVVRALIRADKQFQASEIQAALDCLTGLTRTGVGSIGNPLVVDRSGFYEERDYVGGTSVRLPTGDSATRRSVSEVPVTELGQATFRLVDERRQTVEQLIETIGTLYCWDPSNERVAAVVRHIVSQLLARNHFEQDNGSLTVPEAAGPHVTAA